MTATRIRRRYLAIALGVLWLVVLIGTVVVTLRSRSEFVGTNDGAGTAIVVATLPAMVLGVCLLRRPDIAVVTMAAGSIATCFLAVSILNDESSTAAVGIIVIPPVSLFIVGIGVVVQFVLNSRQRRI
jgi:hypothetical protein